MSTLDLAAIGIYFLIVIVAGVRSRRKARADLDSFFLGGRKIHWLKLAMSASVSNFDITGTMWMVSVLVLLGMQSWWHHWMWGVALPAFALAFHARWVRRSGVMTAAEWMITRFGTGAGGRAARYTTAVAAVITTITMVGYAFQGVGKFAAGFFPLDQLATVLPLDAAWLADHGHELVAVSILALTTLYVIAGGLVGVVVTDVIQTVVVGFAAIWIATVAFTTVDPTRIPDDFLRLSPSWSLPELRGTEHADYAAFGPLVIFWLLKGLLMNAGGPSQYYDFQRFLAASNERDAARLAAAWPFFLAPRWAMVMGIALLAVTGAYQVDDPELVMPAVLRETLPSGLRGLALAGLLAAFMSTFSSTLNAGASYVVRDLWQPLCRPHASETTLVRVSRISTFALVMAGMIVGIQAESIGAIWSWLMMALGAGVLLPNLLRWFWWRLTGWGYSAGLIAGLLLSTLTFLFPDLTPLATFPIICCGSLAACVLVSLLGRPVEDSVLVAFYRQVRPFGPWGKVRRIANQDGVRITPEPSAVTGLNDAAIGVVALTALYLLPMYAVARATAQTTVCGVVLLAAGGLLAARLRRRSNETENPSGWKKPPEDTRPTERST